MRRTEPTFDKPPRERRVDSSVREPAPSFAQLMPVRAALCFLFPFLPAVLSVLVWVLDQAVPGALALIAGMTSKGTTFIVGFLGQGAGGHRAMPEGPIQVDQVALDNLIMSLDLLFMVASLVLAAANCISYRKYVSAYLLFKFNKTPEEFFAPVRIVAPCMLGFGALWTAEFIFGGTTFSLLEMHFDGTPVSFGRFLYRAAIFFSFVTPLMTFGLVLILLKLFGERESAVE